MDKGWGGEYKVAAAGMLTMHGVEKESALEGVITVKGVAIRLVSKFKIHVADHKIKVSSLCLQNVAEDVVT